MERCDVESDVRTPTSRILHASTLLGERGMVQIEHRGEIYTMRITKNNRLILTK